MGLYFEKEDKEILNEAVTPLQVVEYLGLPGQKIGPNISILCPASDHNDHSYGNCVVYDQGRKCRCFACQRSFTPLSILIEAGHYSFYEAMCILASMAHKAMSMAMTEADTASDEKEDGTAEIIIEKAKSEISLVYPKSAEENSFCRYYITKKKEE